MSFFQEKHFLVEFRTVFYADKFIKRKLRDCYVVTRIYAPFTYFCGRFKNKLINIYIKYKKFKDRDTRKY